MTRLFLFDMDGTAVCYANSSFQSSWDALGEAAGLKEEWNRLLQEYLPKPDLYQEWFDKQCKLLKGKEVEPILKQILPPPYAPGFVEFCCYAHGWGAVTGILSSGVDLVAQRIQKEARLDFVVDNELYTNDGEFTGTGKVIVPLDGKGEWVCRLGDRYNICKKDIIYFGDHENDIPAWKNVGTAVGVNVKSNKCHAYLDIKLRDFHQALGSGRF